MNYQPDPNDVVVICPVCGKPATYISVEYYKDGDADHDDIEHACEACGRKGHTVEDCFDGEAVHQWMANVKEQFFAAYTEMVRAASVAVKQSDVGGGAELLGWSRQRVKALGGAWGRMPDVPVTAFAAALHVDEKYTNEALAMVAGGSSAADISDYYDLVVYKRRTSQVPLVETGTVALVEEWEPGRLSLTLDGWTPHGDRPEMVKLGKIVRVLQDGNGKGGK